MSSTDKHVTVGSLVSRLVRGWNDVFYDDFGIVTRGPYNNQLSISDDDVVDVYWILSGSITYGMLKIDFDCDTVSNCTTGVYQHVA